MCAWNCRDELDNSDDEGSISLDEDNDSDGSAMFESDSEEEEELDSDPDVSDPEDEQPKKKRMKAVSSKDFQKKLKHTSSKFGTIASIIAVLFTRSFIALSDSD